MSLSEFFFYLLPPVLMCRNTHYQTHVSVRILIHLWCMQGKEQPFIYVFWIKPKERPHRSWEQVRQQEGLITMLAARHRAGKGTQQNAHVSTSKAKQMEWNKSCGSSMGDWQERTRLIHPTLEIFHQTARYSPLGWSVSNTSLFDCSYLRVS